MIVIDTDVFIEMFKGNDDVISKVENIGYDNLAITSISIGELFLVS